MMKTRIILVVVAILLIVGISQLPRVVVENDAATDAQQLEEPSDLKAENPQGHSLEMSEELRFSISSLQEKLAKEENTKNLINFADSLGRIYLSINQLDSAYRYAQKIIEIDPGEMGRLRSGLLTFSIYELTVDRQQSAALGQKVRDLLEPIAEKSGDESLRIKVGTTYMSTQNPMQGVLMIRKVLEENPRNTEAIFRLGFLSLQSGQVEKAVERFISILDFEPNNWDAVLYLGISYSELGQTGKAKKQFDKIISESNVPVLEQVAQSYLDQIK